LWQFLEIEPVTAFKTQSTGTNPDARMNEDLARLELEPCADPRRHVVDAEFANAIDTSDDLADDVMEFLKTPRSTKRRCD
jgi:hypothetical protein